MASMALLAATVTAAAVGKHVNASPPPYSVCPPLDGICSNASHRSDTFVDFIQIVVYVSGMCRMQHTVVLLSRLVNATADSVHREQSWRFASSRHPSAPCSRPLLTFAAPKTVRRISRMSEIQGMKFIF